MKSENWVFLGDSLTEGIGFSRMGYVSELVRLMRKKANYNVNLIRLSKIKGLQDKVWVKQNITGYMDNDICQNKNSITIWNLASEGTTILDDECWFHLIKSLEPERIFILRGPLESIIRPSIFINNLWPIWIPKSWRTYAGMDPRCYFSGNIIRRYKQKTIDLVKQRIRLGLLKNDKGSPLINHDVFKVQLISIAEEIKDETDNISLLSLPPISESTFPGSATSFSKINKYIYDVCHICDLDFIDWTESITKESQKENLFYRDGFHPNKKGAVFMANLLYEHIFLVT